MTVSTSTNKAIFLGNGATSAFTYTFNMVDASYAVVTYTDASGTQTVIPAGNYTLTISVTGGTLTYPLVGSPIANSTSLTLQRVLPYVQSTSLSNVGALYPTVIEGMGDTLEYQVQQLAEQMARAILMNAADPLASGVLPAAAARINKVLGFDGAGAISLYAPGTVPASATATNITYTATGTGAVTRTTASKLGDFISILDYGADPTGAVAADTAFANAVAAAAGRSLYIPPGLYTFSAQVAFTILSGQSVSIIGAGADVTKFQWAANGGMVVNFTNFLSSLHIRDMSFLAGAAGTGTPAITLNQLQATYANPANTAQSDIINVTFRGSDGYAVANYWSYGVRVFSVSNINFFGVNVVGTGALSGNGVGISGTSTNVAVIYNFTSCMFNFNNTGIVYGTQVQGMTVSQCNFNGGQFGLASSAGAVNLDQLCVAGSQFNNSQAGIDFLTEIPNALITTSLFIVPASAVGIAGNSVEFLVVTGCAFNSGDLPVSNNGLSITNNVGVSLITGNVFANMLGAGVKLQVASSNVNVQSNAYVNNGTNVQDLGAGNTVGGGSP